jgi:hypothetical protein
MSANVNTYPNYDNIELVYDITNPRSYSGTGTTLFDLSNKNNNITLANSPTYTKSGGGYLTFNGTTQTGASLNNVGSGVTYNFARTISVWVRPTSSNDGCIFSYGTYATLTSAFELHQVSNKFRINQGKSGASAVYDGTSTLTITPNTWYHVALLYTGASTHVYINGSLDNNPSGSKFTGNSTMKIATSVDGSIISNFTGDIAEITLSIGNDFDRVKKNYLSKKSRFGL